MILDGLYSFVAPDEMSEIFQTGRISPEQGNIADRV